MRPLLWPLLIPLLALPARACIWDADSLAHEKSRSKDLAAAISDEPAPADDLQKLRARITELEAHRDEASAGWWNNLAGAYLRLNQPAAAVKILGPVLDKFPNDYGIHANLGTAYHLLGRYVDAEKEIARDLEINPDAHFGLEKYHLALLQYLVRDAKYQSRHVYVDELTAAFLATHNARMDVREAKNILDRAQAEYTNELAQAEKDLALLSVINISNWDFSSLELLAKVSALDEPPPYRKNWNLTENTNFEAGVIYMAQMNSKEPAAIEMLGVAAWRVHNYNLAISAFQKAITLNSPQSDLLRAKIDGLNYYIHQSSATRVGIHGAIILGVIILVSLVLLPLFLVNYIYRKIRNRRRNRAY